MIEFNPFLTWSLTLLLIALLLSLYLYLGLVIWNTGLSKNRKKVKLLLNGWLIILLSAFLLQPGWEAPIQPEPLLIHSENISIERLSYLKDSLKTEKSVDIEEYQEDGNPIYLIGHDYTWEQLGILQQKDVRWIPEIKEGQLTHIQWESFRRQGDLQIVAGTMVVKDSAMISLSGFGETIAQTTLYDGKQEFKFSFPVNIPGRNHLELRVNDELIDSINFFVAPNMSVRYQLEFGSPNAEARLLTEFLTKKGHQVNLNIQLSKNMEFRGNPASTDRPDVIITHPALVHRKDIQEAVAEGSNLLVLNLSDPAAEAPLINSLMGTGFRLEGEDKPDDGGIAPDLQTWPYKFQPNITQTEIIRGTMAYQHVGNSKVGISLFESTYPLIFRGDSTSYNRIWEQALGALAPPEKSLYSIEQPVFAQVPHLIKSVQLDRAETFLAIAEDTLNLQPARINPSSSTATWITEKQAWHSLNDSLEVYIYGRGWQEIKSLKTMAQFISSNRQTSYHEDNFTMRSVDGWIWLGLFLISFGVVWIEPRV